MIDLSNFFLTTEFCEKWALLLKTVYLYKFKENFILVPSISQKITYCYLPLLSYTDKNLNDADEMLQTLKNKPYQMRILNPGYKDFKENDPVTLRLDISSAHDDTVFKKILTPKCRNRVRNSLKRNQFIFAHGNDRKFIVDFYKIFSKTMHKHGTPVLSKKLFNKLVDIYSEDVIFYNAYYKGQVIGSMCVLFDEKIAWLPWVGIDQRFRKRLVGYFLIWNTIKNIIRERNMKIFDLGRSNYGGNTHTFKSQWGVQPVKIDILDSANGKNIYDKYQYAAWVWKKLPKFFVDAVGPRLCKYLVDL